MEEYLFHIIIRVRSVVWSDLQILQSGALDKSKLSQNLQRQVDMIESIRKSMGMVVLAHSHIEEEDTSSDELDVDSSSDEYNYLPVENELENYFLNRKMIKEKDYNPVDEDVSDFSITDVSDSESSAQTAFSSPEDVLSASESVPSSPRDATEDALSNDAVSKGLSPNGTAVSFSNDGRVSSPVNVNPSTPHSPPQSTPSTPSPPNWKNRNHSKAAPPATKTGKNRSRIPPLASTASSPPPPTPPRAPRTRRCWTSNLTR